MVVGIMPAKRHGEWVASGGAAAVDGADGENVGEGRRNRCLKGLRTHGFPAEAQVLSDLLMGNTS